MPYLNLDDNFADHPKVDGLTDGAFRLHVAGLCYAAKNLTDGHVPKARLKRLVPEYKSGFLNELTEARMWLPVAGGFQIHDYLDWNKPKSWWDEKREKDAKRKAAWRQQNGGQNEGGTA